MPLSTEQRLKKLKTELDKWHDLVILHRLMGDNDSYVEDMFVLHLMHYQEALRESEYSDDSSSSTLSSLTLDEFEASDEQSSQRTDQKTIRIEDQQGTDSKRKSKPTESEAENHKKRKTTSKQKA